jgi:response regulator RpfG family c-di-GMP phosphodiesterase
MGIQGQAYKDLYYAALLHDIGMIVLNHPALREQALTLGRNPTPERLHPVLGAELIKHVKILEGVVPSIRHHHELWDGSGHPDHLSGEQIPLASRILCLVEYLEEIRFSGLQGAELSSMQARLAKEESGVKFDPQVVDAYLSLVSAGRGAEAR